MHAIKIYQIFKINGLFILANFLLKMLRKQNGKKEGHFLCNSYTFKKMLKFIKTYMIKYNKLDIIDKV